MAKVQLNIGPCVFGGDIVMRTAVGLFSASLALAVSWGCTGQVFVAQTPGGSGSGAACGNSVIDAGEACDDGNKVSDDGCAADCQQIEGGFVCATPGDT